MEKPVSTGFFFGRSTRNTWGGRSDRTLASVARTRRSNADAPRTPAVYRRIQADASGSTAVTSISTLARASTKPATCTQLMAGKLRPITAR